MPEEEVEEFKSKRVQACGLRQDGGIEEKFLTARNSFEMTAGWGCGEERPASEGGP
jgi:hypothetical protein